VPLPVVAVRPLAVPVVALEVAQLLTIDSGIESPMLTATGSVSAHPASGPATASASHCHHCRSGCQSQCQCRCHWHSGRVTVAQWQYVVAQCTVQWHTGSDSGSLAVWDSGSGAAVWHCQSQCQSLAVTLALHSLQCTVQCQCTACTGAQWHRAHSYSLIRLMRTRRSNFNSSLISEASLPTTVHI